MATTCPTECEMVLEDEVQAASLDTVKTHHIKSTAEERQPDMEAPRIGFAQLLPPLFIAWISNCNQTNVAILPTACARVITAAVLTGLLSMCSHTLSSKSSRSQACDFFGQALCVLLLIDILRLDPVEAEALVSTKSWREGTARLFRR